MEYEMGFFISDAMAQAANPPMAMETTSSIFMMIGIFAVFYLLIIRPQSKRAKEHRDLVSKIKAGDEVVTSGGILGEIIRVDEQFITLSIQSGVEMIIQRQAISSVLPKGTLNTVKKA
jgi:preprotein translocase subunit YajC